MYLTFDEYQLFGGMLPENEFIRFEMEAETIIDWYTFNRLSKDTVFPDAVRKCMFVLISLLQSKNQTLSVGQSVEDGTTTAAIASQSNDGVSISYNVMNAQTAYNTIESELGLTVRKYLSGVTNSLGHLLLYRGVY